MRKERFVVCLLLSSLFLFLFAGCKADMEEDSDGQERDDMRQERTVKEEKTIRWETADFSEYFQGINGCAVFYKADSQEYKIYNEALCEQRSSPCSTFKIVASCMGMKYGVLDDLNDRMGYDGTAYSHPEWNRNLTFQEAFQSSCVWYFRKVIDQVGQENVQETVDVLQYGNRDISQWKGNGYNRIEALNGFWLESSLQVSPLEQVKVLRKILEENFFDKETKTMLEELMWSEESIYGKTGTGYDQDGNCVDGWFVGWFEGEERIYFAVRLADPEAEDGTGIRAKEIAKAILLREFSGGKDRL